MDAATCEVTPPRVWRSAPVGVTTVAVGVLVATMLWSATRSSSPGLVGVDVALAVAALILVPVVVRRPRLGGVLAGVLVALSPVATPVASFAVLFIARNRPFRQAAAVAAVGVAGEAVQALWRPVPSLPYGWRLVLMTIAYAALLGWGTWAQARNALLAALRDRARRAERSRNGGSTRRGRRSAAGSRGRCTTCWPTGCRCCRRHAGAMEYRPDAPPERLSAAAGVIRASAHHALDELREVITLLRSDDTESPTDGRPGRPSLTCRAWSTRRGPPGNRSRSTTRSARRSRSPRRLAAPRTGSRRRALTNARKHAAGQPVRLVLGGAPGPGPQHRGEQPDTRRTAAPPAAPVPAWSASPNGPRSPAVGSPTAYAPPAVPPHRVAAVADVTGPIRVVIVDDDPLVRGMLTLMLDGADGIVVVGEAADGATAITAVDRHLPDVVLMDIRMPGVNGITATERLRRRPPATRDHRAHHVRHRRARGASPPSRRERLPAQGHPARADQPGGPRGGGRQPDAVSGR